MFQLHVATNILSRRTITDLASLCFPEGCLARYWAEQTIDLRTLDRFASILHGAVQLPRVCDQRRTKGGPDKIRETLEREVPRD